MSIRLLGIAIVLLGGAAAWDTQLHAPQPQAAAQVVAPAPTPPRGARAPSTKSQDVASHATQPCSDFIGVFVAREAVEIAPLISGRIAVMRARIGDHVVAGQVLAQLDTRAQRLDLAVARAQAARVGAELEVARLLARNAAEHATRWRSLGGIGVASGADQAAAEGDAQSASLRATAASASVRYERAVVERLQRELDEGLIRAPFDGLVVARYIDPGASVTEAHALYRLVGSATALVRFAVPEERAVELRPGNLVIAHSSGGRALRAEVKRISAEVDKGSRLFVAEAELQEVTGGMLLGSAARVTLQPYAAP